jgi:hypothetical protein
MRSLVVRGSAGRDTGSCVCDGHTLPFNQYTLRTLRWVQFSSGAR